ncbi:MAG: hypothetical protein M3N51_09970 [Actinomycetota bacterium]|nr:hypothetical protein [Actinomycetota bacterium]
MSEAIVRLAVVGAVVMVALLVGWALRSRRAGVGQGRVRVDGLGPWPAVLVFTRETCATCRPVLELLEEMPGRWPVRELRYDEEPALFDGAGVAVVPLVVVVGPDGQVLDQLAGLPSRPRLSKALSGT